MLSSIIVAIVIAAMTIFLFGSAMRGGFDHDENLYCTAGALTASGHIMYKDFAFLQMPLLPVIYAFLFTLFKTTNYLLVGRVFSVACSILTMFLVLIAFLNAFHRQRLTGLFLGTVAIVLYTFNKEVGIAGSFAWNHSLAILCILLAYLILVSLDFSKPPETASMFLVGFLNGAAISTRLSFAFATLVFFLILAFFIPVSLSIRYKKILLPFLAGVIVPSGVAIYYFFLAPHAFFFDTIQYFFITGNQRWFPGWHAVIGFKEKLLMAFKVLTDPSYLVILILFFFSSFLTVSGYKLPGWRKTPIVLASSLAVAMFIAAFVVTPMHDPYFAPSIPFLLITMAYAFSDQISAVNRERGKKIIACSGMLLIVLYIVPVTLYDQRVLKNFETAFSTKDWTPTKVYTISEKVSEIAGSGKIILTLEPIFALEAGERIYQELSTGPFLFRYGRFLSDAQRRIAVSTDSSSLSSLLQKNPPDAILVGLERISLEAPLIEYAIHSGWRQEGIGKFKLYFTEKNR